MAKYDSYEISLTSGSSTKPLTRELSVLFEAGDDIQDVIMAADLVLISEAELGGGSITEALLDLPEADFIALLIEVWIEQMNLLGNDKYDYANRLRDAINTAQNQSA